MTPERWHRITEIFHASVARDAKERDAFLRSACQDDPELRADVDDLLSAHEQAGSFGKTGIVGLSGLESAVDCQDVPRGAGMFSPGDRLADRFTIVRSVGEGGMGTVYEAIDEKLNHRVALKCAHAGYGHRLPPEARAAREVSHFNVCKMHDLHVVTTGDREINLLSMELIEGETLSQRIVRDGRLSVALAREIALQICAGLAQAHRQQVVHGDLKCDNVILGKSAQGSLRAVVTDFGLARLKVDADSGERGGTRSYMAPELMRGGRASIASDIYALGVVLHVMLVGKPPRRDDPRCIERPGIAPLPSPWSACVRRCLQPDPAKRPASADEVARSLAPHRWRWRVTTAALGVAAILTWILTLNFQPEQQEPLGPPVRLLVLPLAASAGDARPETPTSIRVGTSIAARLTGLRSNFTVIPPTEATLNHVDTPEKARRVLGATHVLDARVDHAGAKSFVSASLIDLQSGRNVRELSGAYPSGDSQLVRTALVAMVMEAFRLPAGDPGELLAGPAGAAYTEGMDLLRESGTNAAKAVPYFLKAIEWNPRSALPYAGLAEAQLQLFNIEGGEWAERAGANVRMAKSLNAASVPVLLVSGALALETSRYEDAIRDFSRVTELEPTNSDAWRRLATAYERTNRDEVVATYGKAIRAQPGYYRHYLLLGNFYFENNQFERAETLARKVVELVPGLAAGHINLGLALMRQGRFGEAELSLLAALRIQESALLLSNIGALYYAQEHYDEALRYFERCLSSGPPSFVRYANLGDAYRHLGREDEAATAYRNGLALVEAEVARDPRRAVFRAFMGMMLAQLRDRRRAEAELSQSLALEPGNATVMRQAAIGYEALGLREKTLSVLRSAPDRLLQELAQQPDVRDLQRDRRFLNLVERNSPQLRNMNR